MQKRSDPSPARKYTVSVNGVEEVTLAGTADLAFWGDRLEPEGYYPLIRGGKAELTISATNSKWMGMTFQELSIAVSVCLEEGRAEADGLFLVQAFNSRRFFVFVERTFFQTPYAVGEIQLKAYPPFGIVLAGEGNNFITAEMAASTPLTARGDEYWEGPIFLPGRSGKRRWFYARLSGYTERYPCQLEADRLLINSSASIPIFEWLKASNFDGVEWRIRKDAAHARSRTYQI